MDQEAFRKLLNSSNQPPASAAASSSSPFAPGPSRGFGSTAKRSAASQSRTRPEDLVKSAEDNGKGKEQGERRPRGPQKNSTTGEAYVDRAQARRLGKEDRDEAEVTELHKEWREKWQAAKTEDERRDIEEQMAYLGGDAKHTILVKGLDFALLARERAKAEGRELGQGDDDLEAAYQGAAPATSTEDGHSSGSPEAAAASSQSSGKRSREEVLAALKKRKLQKASSPESHTIDTRSSEQKARDAEFERARQLGKFRPIGADSAPGKGGGFKSVASSAGGCSHAGGRGDVIVTKDGKRLRKKVKKPALAEEVMNNVASLGEATLPEPEQLLQTGDRGNLPPEAEALPPKEARSEETERSQGVTGTKMVEDASGPQTRELPPAPEVQELPPAALSDEDEDIFADVGRWEGLQSEEDSEEEGGEGSGAANRHGGSRSLATPPSSALKHDWFAADARDGGDGHRGREDEVGLDGSLGRVIAGLSQQRGDQQANRSHEKVLPGDEDDRQRDGESASSSSASTRLQGFSDSALPSDYARSMLEEEKEKQRRQEEKKLAAQRERWRKKKMEKKGEAGEEGEGREYDEVQEGEDA
ncbi:unnamed protein product [Jaminaea pallidilutea]